MVGKKKKTSSKKMDLAKNAALISLGLLGKQAYDSFTVSPLTTGLAAYGGYRIAEDQVNKLLEEEDLDIRLDEVFNKGKETSVDQPLPYSFGLLEPPREPDTLDNYGRVMVKGRPKPIELSGPTALLQEAYLEPTWMNLLEDAGDSLRYSLGSKAARDKLDGQAQVEQLNRRERERAPPSLTALNLTPHMTSLTGNDQEQIQSSVYLWREQPEYAPGLSAYALKVGPENADLEEWTTPELFLRYLASRLTPEAFNALDAVGVVGSRQFLWARRPGPNGPYYQPNSKFNLRGNPDLRLHFNTKVLLAGSRSWPAAVKGGIQDLNSIFFGSGLQDVGTLEDLIGSGGTVSRSTARPAKAKQRANAVRQAEYRALAERLTQEMERRRMLQAERILNASASAALTGSGGVLSAIHEANWEAYEAGEREDARRRRKQQREAFADQKQQLAELGAERRARLALERETKEAQTRQVRALPKPGFMLGRGRRPVPSLATLLRRRKTMPFFTG